MLQLLIKKITYNEINFIKFSSASYKVGWYSNFAGIKDPPSIFDKKIAINHKMKWKNGYRERSKYIKSIDNKYSKYNSTWNGEFLPNYFYVLYNICPHCSKDLDNYKHGIYIIKCTDCDFSFSLLESMPYSLIELFRKIYHKNNLLNYFKRMFSYFKRV